MKYFIVSCVVILVLGLIEKKVEKGGTNKLQSEEKFIARVQGIMFTLGAIVIGMIVAIYIFFGITDPEQLNDIVANVCFIVLGTLGIYSMLLIVPGFWEIRVDGDDICVVKCFLYKKSYKFSELTRCKMTRGGARFYIEGCRRKAFFLDAMMIGADLFMKRTEKAGIPIDEFVDKSLEEEGK